MELLIALLDHTDVTLLPITLALIDPDDPDTTPELQDAIERARKRLWTYRKNIQ